MLTNKSIKRTQWWHWYLCHTSGEILRYFGEWFYNWICP